MRHPAATAWLLAMLLGATASCAQSQVGDTINAPVSRASGYRIGIGDVLHVSVWGQDQITRDVVVQPDGRISLPLISQVVASGLTVGQTEEELHGALLPYVKTPRVTVSVVEAKSKVIYVTGEVLRPGGYLLIGPSTALQLLVRAGGPTDFAKLKKSYVLRPSGERVPVNLKAILKGKSPESNVSLVAGDTVVVP